MSQWVIFYRSGQSYLPIHARFAPKADLKLATTGTRRVEVTRKPVIEAPKRKPRFIVRYELTDTEMARLKAG